MPVRLQTNRRRRRGESKALITRNLGRHRIRFLMMREKKACPHE
jgi:hypothetical protein